MGVHLTPTFDRIDGRYEIGSTVTIGSATGRGVSKEDSSTELFPSEHYHRLAYPFLPDLLPEDIELHQAGIQSKIKGY